MNDFKTVVITGVSTGIGRAAARELVANGYTVFGSVRRREDGEQVRRELGERFTPLLFDVTDEAAIHRAREQVELALGGRGLSGLVNNAGVAVPGSILHLSLEDLRLPLEVNLLGVLRVTKTFLPLLGASDHRRHLPGRIVNISSVSGWHTFPFNTSYSMSKAGLEALSDGLRRELRPYGIDVVVVVPGSVQTPIWDKVQQLDLTRYDGTVYQSALQAARKLRVEYGKKSLPVERLSRVIRLALESPRPKTRYRVLGSPLTEWILPRWLPDRWWDRILWRMLGLSSRE